jgi:hypothetical protein
MTSPVVTLAQAGVPPITGLSTSINGDEGTTFHHGGPSPWTGGGIDRSSAAAFAATAPHSRCPSIWRAWDAFHRSKGWVGIAYNFGACPHGFVFEGRGAGYRSAAQGTNAGNATSHAVVAMIGDGDPFTDPCKQAALDARHFCRSHPKRPANDVLHKHKDWHSTACPGDQVSPWVDNGAPAPGLVWAPPQQVQLGTDLAAFAPTPTGRGYLLVGTDGGVFTMGDAMYWGSLPGLGIIPNALIVGAAVSPSGGGYTLVASDGGVFTFGDAPYLGSMGGVPLNDAVSEFAITPTGAGYWMAALDAGVFAFGDAPFVGSA